MDVPVLGGTELPFWEERGGLEEERNLEGWGAKKPRSEARDLGLPDPSLGEPRMNEGRDNLSRPFVVNASKVMR